MHPEAVQICDDPRTGAAVIHYEKAASCHEAAYAVTYLDFTVLPA
jgi:hypothetical protein